jgi:hypothetical protein
LIADVGRLPSGANRGVSRRPSAMAQGEVS